jgi:hypothetical protein
MAPIDNVALQWAEEEKGTYGDGISRPRPLARTREYRVIVYPQGARPLTWFTKAESKRHAIRYARNRWPGCEVEMA